MSHCCHTSSHFLFLTLLFCTFSALTFNASSESSPESHVVCNSQFRRLLPSDFIDSHQIEWKDTPFTTTDDSFICSVDAVSLYVRDTQLYYLLGFLSTFFSGNRVVGHLFEERSYRKAQSLFFKGIRRNSEEIRLLTTPVLRRDLQMNTAIRVYELTKHHMEGGADVLFLQLDDLQAMKQAVRYTSQTNQKLIIWKHSLKDIPAAENKVIARVTVNFAPVVEDIVKQEHMTIVQELPEEIKINKIYDAHELFGIEWMPWVEDLFKEEVEDMWERVKTRVQEKEHMTPIEWYGGYEFQ